MSSRGASVLFAGLLVIACGRAPTPAPAPPRPIDLDQGWTAAEIQQFYTLPEGTELLDLRWLKALGNGTLATGRRMEELRFLSNPNDVWGLPVGWTFQPALDPAKPAQAGFSCAACHTNELHYRGARVRIQGGPALHDDSEVQGVLGRVLVKTLFVPSEFSRFAALVKDPEGNLALWGKLWTLFYKTIARIPESARLYPTAAGPGRLEAFGRGANVGFGEANPGNKAVEDGPVSFPALWDTGRFDWAQYDSNVRGVAPRNIAQAIGTHAGLNLSSRSTETAFGGISINFDRAGGGPMTSIPLDDLHRLQKLVDKLRSPCWPESIFGEIDEPLETEGKRLYETHCASCHEARSSGGHYDLELTFVSLRDIGTDPEAALDFANRTVDLRGIISNDPNWADKVPVWRAFELLTGLIISDACDPVSDPDNADFCTRPIPNDWRAPIGYKARPLNGSWATGPFLHNGSVPTLYALLSPLPERPARFYMGTRQFDPVYVGFEWQEKFAGAMEFDTGQTGNSNLGHENCSDCGGRPGTIGPEFSHDQRMALIEYIKGLSPLRDSQGNPYACR